MIINITYSSDAAHKAVQLIHSLISRAYRDQGELVYECFMVEGDNAPSESCAPSITTKKVIKHRGVWRFIPSGLVKKIKAIVTSKKAKFIICDGLGVARCMFPVFQSNDDVKLIVVIHGVVKFKPQDLANFKNYSERVRLIFVSSSLAKEMQHRYPVLSKLSYVIPNTLPPEFTKGLVPRVEARVELGLPVDKKLYVVASRLSSKKDVSTVIRAFAKIVDAEKYLVIMGDGPERPKLENLSADLGVGDSVMWLNWIKGSSRYLKAFDVFVSASISEGFGLSVLEAHASGLSVICSDIEPHKEVLGESAAYFNVSDTEDCAEKLLVDSWPSTDCNLDVKYQQFCSSYREILSF